MRTTEATVTPSLFGCEVERVTGMGTTVRVLVEAVDEGQVRVLRYERRAPGRDFVTVPAEVGRVLPWAQLHAGAPFAAAFPAGVTTGAPVSRPAPRRRRR